MLKSCVRILSKQKACSRVISFKTRLMLVVLPSELLQCTGIAQAARTLTKLILQNMK